VHPLPSAQVEPCEGLAEEQHAGLSQQHAGQGEAALHVRREGARALVGHAIQLHLGQRGHEAGGGGVAAAHDLPKPAVLSRGEVLVDVGAVRDHRQQRPHALRVAPGVDAADLERARGRPEERGQDADQRGLAGPVGAEQGDSLATPNVETHTVENGHETEGLAHDGDATHGIGTDGCPALMHVAQPSPIASRLALNSRTRHVPACCGTARCLAERATSAARAAITFPV